MYYDAQMLNKYYFYYTLNTFIYAFPPIRKISQTNLNAML